MGNDLDQQRIADQFKVAIERIKAANTTPDGKTERNADNRRAALYALQRFEAASWYPEALTLALSPALDLDDLLESGTPIDDLRDVLERYIDIVEEKTGAVAIQNEMFTARHASWYIARQLTKRGTPMTFAGIDKHIRVKQDLRGRMVGSTMIFTRQQLDEYVANFDNMPKRGRPVVNKSLE